MCYTNLISSGLPALCIKGGMPADGLCRVFAFDDYAVGLESAHNNLVKRLQMNGQNDEIVFFKSADSGSTWTFDRLVKQSVIDPTSIGATYPGKASPYRCIIYAQHKIGVCSFYGILQPSSSEADVVILKMNCQLAAIFDFSAADRNGNTYYGYANQDGVVYTKANRTGQKQDLFFSFPFILA